MLGRAFEYITVPLDEYQLSVLRNVVLFAVITFVVMVVGLGQFIVFAVYLLAIAVACVSTWLLTLDRGVCHRVLDRVRDVLTAFWRQCVDESFGGAGERVRVERSADGATATDTRAGARGLDRAPGTAHRLPVGTSDVGTDDGADSQKIRELSEEFKSLFELVPDSGEI